MVKGREACSHAREAVKVVVARQSNVAVCRTLSHSPAKLTTNMGQGA
jgi:hypothetical protein